MNNPKVGIVILNWNNSADTIECLSSVFKIRYDNYFVIVVDNGSTDDSIEKICNAFPYLEVLPLKINTGYAGGINKGIQNAITLGSEWILVLNQDTIMAPECLTRMIEIGESRPNTGVVGPMVYHYDEPLVIQSAGGYLDSRLFATHLGQNEEDCGQFENPHAVDWISGCAIMAKRSVLEQIGLMDERFFLYLEELEWCIRARKRGWDIIHVPQAKLWHKGVQRNYHPSPSVTYYCTRNRFLLLSKHHASLIAWISAWVDTVWTLVAWTINPKRFSLRKNRNAMVHGIRDFLRNNWGQMPL